MDVDVDEEAMTTVAHFFAGALAGTAEHTGMYPVDTIKTHIQAQRTGTPMSLSETARHIFERGGVRGFFRGITAIAGGAAPAHALYFSSYEYCKRLTKFTDPKFTPLIYAMSGAVATILMDGVMTPMDTIKQRRQLCLKHYRSNWDCFRTIRRLEGYRALYAGYTTTLFMNVPFHAIYLNIYELLRSHLQIPEQYNLQGHILAGSGAGVVAAGLTNPLDVAKTRLQTQGDVGGTYRGMFHALKEIWKEEGPKGFARGISARMLFHCFSAGLLWSTYEYFKFIFGAK